MGLGLKAISRKTGSDLACKRLNLVKFARAACEGRCHRDSQRKRRFTEFVIEKESVHSTRATNSVSLNNLCEPL